MRAGCFFRRPEHDEQDRASLALDQAQSAAETRLAPKRREKLAANGTPELAQPLPRQLRFHDLRVHRVSLCAAVYGARNVAHPPSCRVSVLRKDAGVATVRSAPLARTIEARPDGLDSNGQGAIHVCTSGP